jgi:hypothetical protein
LKGPVPGAARQWSAKTSARYGIVAWATVLAKWRWVYEGVGWERVECRRGVRGLPDWEEARW